MTTSLPQHLLINDQPNKCPTDGARTELVVQLTAKSYLEHCPCCGAYFVFHDEGDPDHWNMTEQEMSRRGGLLARVFHLRSSRRDKDGNIERYACEWGDKTPLGVFRTAQRILEDGE